MKSKTFSGNSIESLDVNVNLFITSRAVRVVEMSNFFVSGGVFYLNIIYTAN